MAELLGGKGRWRCEPARQLSGAERVKPARTELLVLQPTPFCNLDCSYCYLPDRNLKTRMSRATLERVGRVILAHGRLAGDLTLVWHAGEPCILPADWYLDAFEILKRHRPAGVRLTHSFQTNATLLDDGWLTLLARPDVRVGVSLDGPAELHDRHRKNRAGRGSFEAVMAGIERLRRAGIDFHIITVLTAASLEQPDLLIDFLLGEGFPQLCFNVEEIDGTNTASSLAGDHAEALFARFLDRLFNALAESANPPWVREVQYCENAVLYTGSRAAASNHQLAPLAILSVAVDGRLSTFSPELLGVSSGLYDDFLFGDLKELESPEQLLTAPALRRAAAAIEAGRAACRRDCAHFRWCGGGAPANKLGETGRLDGSETLYCRLTVKTLLDRFLDSKLGGAGGQRRAAS